MPVDLLSEMKSFPYLQPGTNCCSGPRVASASITAVWQVDFGRKLQVLVGWSASPLLTEVTELDLPTVLLAFVSLSDKYELLQGYQPSRKLWLHF